MSKGISPFISYLLYVGVGLVVVSIVATTGTATIDAMRDSAAIEQMRTEMSELSGLVDSVAASGQGTQMTTNIGVDRGSMRYVNQTLLYEIQTPAQIISPGTRQSFGQVAMTANAGVSLTEATYNGQDCYKLDNDYLETCIRKIDDIEQHSLSDMILYLDAVDVDGQTHPSIDTILDGTDTTSDGKIKTQISEQNQFLGTGTVRILVKPQNNPGYTVAVSLRTGADFLQVTIE